MLLPVDPSCCMSPPPPLMDPPVAPDFSKTGSRGGEGLVVEVPLVPHLGWTWWDDSAKLKIGVVHIHTKFRVYYLLAKGYMTAIQIGT